MTTTSKVLKELAAQREAPIYQQVRTNYRCAANGCPNAGCMDDHGPGTGKCFFHWRETDPKDWDRVTQKIRANFATMRNH